MAEYEYKIIAGWDDAGNLVNIEDLTPASTDPIPQSGVYYMVKAAKSYRRGQKRFSADGGASYAGFKTVVWTLHCTHSAYADFYDSYNGQCTVRTTTGEIGTYSNWNAYIDAPDPADCTEIDNTTLEADVVLMLVEAPSA